MGTLTLPPEESYGEIESAVISLEPPGLLPIGQDSVWGQLRKTWADYLQEMADQLDQWWNDLDPETCGIDDIPFWEEELAIPTDPTKTLAARRAFIMSRRQRGAFTRARRRAIVESFIVVTFGPAIEFTSAGVPFVVGGIPFFSGVTNLAGTYNIVENISAFTYDVRILNTITIDTNGLTRELKRITPAGIAFTITSTATP